MKTTHSTYKNQADNNSYSQKRIHTHTYTQQTMAQINNVVMLQSIWHRIVFSHFFHSFWRCTHCHTNWIFPLSQQITTKMKTNDSTEAGGAYFPTQNKNVRKQTQHNQKEFFFLGFYFNCTCWLCVYLLKYLMLRSCATLSLLEEGKK